MLPLHSFFVFAAFAVLCTLFGLQLIWLVRHRKEAIGIPPIDPFYYVAGKGAFLTTWVLFILKAASPHTGYILLPDSVSWVAIGLLCLGAIVLIVATFNLGGSVRSGLPRTQTALKTRGLYRYSRNPMYLGFYLIALASCLYFPDLLNVSFTLYGIYLHHKIIRHEERFLQEKFGSEWIIYSTRVSRYL